MDLNRSNSSSDTTDPMDLSSFMSSFERQIKFYLLLFMQILSIMCTIYIFFHFKWRHLQSQIYGFLLIVNGLIISIELSFTLYFLHEGTIHSESRCAAWITLNYSLFQLSIYLMAWTSIERYLFIYHERLIMGHIILLHYAPIVLLSVYCPLFYIGTVLLHNCQPIYDVRLYICGGPCYSFELALGLFDWIGNGICMEMVTLIINVILIIRHIIQRCQMRRVIVTADGRHRWNRSAKLIVQLLSIAMLYIIAWIPYSTIVLIQLFQGTERLAYILSTFFAYVPYLQSLILPYVCIFFLPEVRQRFVALFSIPCFGKTRIAQQPIPTLTNQRKTTAI